jgi:hypothetical protein
MSSSPIHGSRPREGGGAGHDLGRITPLAFRLGLAALTAILFWRVTQFAAYVHTVFAYPYQIDYGEGIVWQQMRNMLAGVGYAPLQTFPAIVYHYPPVYHMTTAALAGATGMDQLVAGRLVSLLATLVTALCAGLIVRRILPPRDGAFVRAGGAILAGLLFLTCYPVMDWAPLMRVDMLTGAFGIAGMIVALRAIERPALIHVAALFFTLSIYTKQISFAAPLATFIVLLLVARPVALRGIASGLAMAVAALIPLVWLTHGQFLTHILSYNVNRLAPEILVHVLLPQLRHHAALILVAALGAATCWRWIKRDGLGAHPAAAMLLAFAALKTVLLLGMLKSGSSFNYMVEWFSAMAALAAIGLRPVLQRAAGVAVRPTVMASAAVTLLALMFQLWMMAVDLPNIDQARRAAASHVALVQRIAAARRPVISDDMTFIIRAGKAVEYEPAITAELGAAGIWDQQGFARMVRARCFAFFVTYGDVGSIMFEKRYNPPIARAIAEAYPKRDYSGKFVIHLPAHPPTDCPLRPGV